MLGNCPVTNEKAPAADGFIHAVPRATVSVADFANWFVGNNSLLRLPIETSAAEQILDFRTAS
jgi:uncharacterized protein (DUF952 family)